MVVISDYKHGLNRIIRAWRVKIGRALERGSRYNFWHLINCNRKELQDYIERHFKSGMTWDNYGRVWEMRIQKKLEVRTLEDLYQKFEHTNYLPQFYEVPGMPVLRQRKRP